MRIVLDTNVVLSALLWRGTPYRLLQTIRQREAIELFSSPALLSEFATVLTRPGPAKRLRIIGRTARQMLSEYLEVVEVVTPDVVPRIVPGDADDDHVVAAAVAAGADIIASGDAHLLSMGFHQAIHILKPVEVLSRIMGDVG